VGNVEGVEINEDLQWYTSIGTIGQLCQRFSKRFCMEKASVLAREKERKSTHVLIKSRTIKAFPQRVITGFCYERYSRLYGFFPDE